MTGYEFAVLRYVHNVATGEFVNVGVVMWSRDLRRFLYQINSRYGRISKFFSAFDGATYRQLVDQLERVFGEYARAQGQRDLFEEPYVTLEKIQAHLLPDDASCFQWSDRMYGISEDCEVRFEQLFEEFVSRHEAQVDRVRRQEPDMWSDINSRIRARQLNSRLRRQVELRTDNYEYSFPIAWKNGQLNVLEAITFDLVNPRNIVEKANNWSGRLLTLSRENDFKMSAILAEPQTPQGRQAFERARNILKAAPSVGRLYVEEDLDDALTDLERDIASHSE